MRLPGCAFHSLVGCFRLYLIYGCHLDAHRILSVVGGTVLIAGLGGECSVLS